MNTGILEIRYCVCQSEIDEVVNESGPFFLVQVFLFLQKCIFLSKLVNICS